MVRAGMAWAYTRYLTDPQIRAMEVVARRENWDCGPTIRTQTMAKRSVAVVREVRG